MACDIGAFEVEEAAAEVNLVVGKSDTPDPVFAGDTLTYTLDVDNIGSADAPRAHPGGRQAIAGDGTDRRIVAVIPVQRVIASLTKQTIDAIAAIARFGSLEELLQRLGGHTQVVTAAGGYGLLVCRCWVGR